MRIITSKLLVSEIAAHWLEAYGSCGPRGRWYSRRHAKIWDRLCNLSRRATPATVAKIIGNTSWTKIQCDECRAEVPAVVEVGAPRGFGSNNAWLCSACVAKAMKQLHQ